MFFLLPCGKSIVFFLGKGRVVQGKALLFADRQGESFSPVTKKHFPSCSKRNLQLTDFSENY